MNLQKRKKKRVVSLSLGLHEELVFIASQIEPIVPSVV